MNVKRIILLSALLFALWFFIGCTAGAPGVGYGKPGRTRYFTIGNIAIGDTLIHKKSNCARPDTLIVGEP